jgi:hypothetical protein
MRLIDADALLDKTVRRNSAWNSITNSEGKNLEEIVSEMPSIEQQIGDLISREDTLTAFADYVGSGMSMNDYDALYDIVAKMPPKDRSVQDFVDKCRECGREKVLDKIKDEVFGIDDKIVLNPDSVFDRKAYVRLIDVANIIDKYKAESEEA